MPLPLIPVLLGGAALLVGGYGVKKGLDAKEDFDRAKSITADAREIYDDAVEELEEIREATQTSLQELGKTKINLYETCLTPFIEAAQKIKHIEHDDELDFDTTVSIEAELAEIRQVSLAVSDLLVGGAAALSSGALAVFGAGALATTASTGLAALSGAAATNATLAWFGGGALAAGGLGMAGGTVVLGGIVAAPVLAVGGLVLASKAEAAVNDAYSNLEKARAAAESMKAACTGAETIKTCAEEMQGILEELMPHCQTFNQELQELVERETDYRIIKNNSHDRFVVKTSFELARTASNILKTPLFDDSGTVTQEVLALLQENKDFLKRLAAM